MCKYCDTRALKQMHSKVDALLSEDYSDDIADKLNDTLDGHSVFTTSGWTGNVFYFLDGTYWDEDGFGSDKWVIPFKHCPMCGRKLSMWVTITAEYSCELVESDATAIESGEMSLQDIDARYYVDNFSTSEVTDIREG